MVDLACTDSIIKTVGSRLNLLIGNNKYNKDSHQTLLKHLDKSWEVGLTRDEIKLVFRPYGGSANHNIDIFDDMDLIDIDKAIDWVHFQLGILNYIREPVKKSE